MDCLVFLLVLLLHGKNFEISITLSKTEKFLSRFFIFYYQLLFNFFIFFHNYYYRNNLNLKRLAMKVKSPCIFAHVRAAYPGMLVTEANCHPFQHGRFLWMHNGKFHRIF